MEKRRSTAVARRSALADFGLQALSQTDIGELLRSAAEIAADALGADLACVLELEPDGNALRLVATFGCDLPREPVLCDLALPVPAAEAVRKGEPVLVRRGAGGALPEDAFLRRERVESTAAVAISSAGGPFGAIAVHSREVAAFRSMDLPFLQSIANVVAAAIARERAAAEARGLATIVESCNDAIFSRTHDGLVATWNAAAERLYGYSAEEMIGNGLTDLVPLDRRHEMGMLAERLFAGERITKFETVRLHKDGTPLDVSSTLSPVRDETGRIASISVVSRSIGEEKRAQAATERLLAAEQAAREAAESAGERLAFLAQASEILAGSLDFAATLSGVARLCVPWLADWCVVYVLGEDGTLNRVAVAHGDPEKERLAEAMKRTGTPASSGRHGLAEALRTGKAQLTAVTDGDLDEAAGGDANLRALFDELSIQQAMFVPLRTRDRVLGAISFISENPERTYGEADLQLAEELAGRAALAVDNAQLYMDAQHELERRTRVEESLRRSEEQYRLLFDANPNPMYFFSIETLRFLAVNEAAVHKYGYTREEFLTMTAADIRPAEDVERLRRSIDEALAVGGLAQTGTWRHLRKDGSLVEVDVTAHPVAFEEQQALVVLALDVTERLAAERALRQSEARYRELVENASELIATVDLELRFTSVNAAFAKALGYSREELLGRSLRDFVPPDQPLWLEQARDAKIEGEIEVATYEHDLATRDGRHITVEVASLLIKENGRPAGVQAICRDISERKAAERFLRAAEERYRTLVEGLPLVTFTHAPTPEAPATYVSPQVEELLGYALEEWHADPQLFWKLLHPEDRERLREAEADGTLFNRFRMIARDGHEVWIFGERHVVRDESGEPLYVQGFWLDITDSERSAKELRESQELYRTVVENTRDMVTIFGPDGRILFASPSVVDVLGYSEDELVGSQALDFVHPDDAGPAAAVLSDPAANGYGRGRTFRLRHKDGHHVEIESSVIPILNSDGTTRMALATSRDVAERLRAEELAEQLRQAQKMEAIGRLAGGIAHDFNNLLTVITGYSDLARVRTDAAEINEAIEQISAAARTGSALTGQLLAFSRQQVVQPTVLDLGATIRNIESMLDRLLGEDVILTLELDPALWAISADPTQVEQVLLNLAVNARDAMREGGRLTIEARNIVVDERQAPSYVDLEPGPYLAISVSDTGVGMDDATRARIFEPFFTTKEDGTGLGLASVHGVVIQSGGRVLVESELGVGTTFRLVFPAVAGPPAEAAHDGAARQDLDGTQTVLIVEDEEIVRGLAQEILRGHGYTVLAAATPDEALEIASSWKEPLDLVLSDVMLPGICGPRLVEEVQSLHPEAKTIYTSGYAPALIAERGVQSEQPFLPKPFTATALASKVREVLAV